MKKHLNVIEHDYGEGGDKKLVVFETKDIAQRVHICFSWQLLKVLCFDNWYTFSLVSFGDTQ